MPDALGIHVIGGGFGESIIVEMPRRKFGVIDCYSSSLRHEEANPTIRFLSQQRVEALEFLAFTHPHADHGRGLSHLLEHYRERIGQLWVFAPFQCQYLMGYFRAMGRSGTPLDIEEILGEPPGSFAIELLKIRNMVRRQADHRAPNRARLKRFCGYHRVQCSHGVTVHFLGPDEAIVDAYEARVADSLTTVADDDWTPTHVNHNDVSPSFLIEFGEARIILGGDMEIHGWEQVLADVKMADRPSLACQIVKLSHHGSTNGTTDGLLEHFQHAEGAPIAILTPFTRSRSPLPTAEGIDRIRNGVARILATNVDAARQSAGRPARDLPAVPSSWMIAIGADPALAGVLDPSLSDQPRPPVPVPPAWMEDIRRNPVLSDLLRPESRSGFHSRHPTVEVDYRISLFLDREGRVVNEFVGAGAGAI